MNRELAWRQYLPPLFALLILLAILFYSRFGCVPSDEEAIRALIMRLAQAAERRDVGDFLEEIAPDYHDEFHSSVDDLHRHLVHTFFRYRRIAVTLSPIEVEKNPRHPHEAWATFQADVRFGTDPTHPPPERLLHHFWKTDGFRLTLRRRDRRWWVVRCERPPDREERSVEEPLD